MYRYTPFDVSPWRVLDEMLDVDRRLNRVLRATADQVARRYPRVNILAGEDRILVDAELPGVDPKQVEVAVESQVLTLRGSRGGDDESEANRFERRFELPYPVAEADVAARFARGILRIDLPKAPEARPRRIAVSQE